MDCLENVTCMSSLNSVSCKELFAGSQEEIVLAGKGLSQSGILEAVLRLLKRSVKTLTKLNLRFVLYNLQ